MATTITISSTDDGSFGESGYSGSLREAIEEIAVAGDIITFDSALDGQAISLTAGELNIDYDLTIDGDLDNDGNPDITIQRDLAAPLALEGFRIFNVDDGTSSLIDVTLDGLVITGGLASILGESGGGIRTDENLTVANSIIDGNSARGTFSYNAGGGISGGAGTLVINNSIISNNSNVFVDDDFVLSFPGGGIAVYQGNLEINDSIISNNSVGTGGPGGGGAGLVIRGPSGGISNVIIRNSTIENNAAQGAGGGILIEDAVDFRLEDSTLRNNSTTKADGAAYGGGIAVVSAFSPSTLTVIGSTIEGNSTTGDTAPGGGIYAFAADVSLTDSIVSTNSTSGINSSGGGVHSYQGRLIVHDTTINGNYTLGDDTSGFGDGGGIHGRQLSEFLITGSTIADNYTEGNDSSGGGVYSNNQFGLTIVDGVIKNNSTRGTNSYGGGIYTVDELTLANMTVSGNTANGIGGGIYTFGSANVSNSTIVFNSAQESGGLGGNISTINNSIIAGNTASIGPDVSGFVTNSNGSNLIGDLTGSTGFAPDEELTVPLSDVLNPTLQNNGGPTETHALVAGSPAIDAGINTDLPADSIDRDEDGNTTEAFPFDQRGVGFNRVVGAATDIGAFEKQPPPVVAAAFDVTNDHVLLGEANLTFTLVNQSSMPLEEFEARVVYSDDDIIGNSDDQTVNTYTATDFLVGEQVTDGLIIQLPQDLLNSRALADDLPGMGAGYISTSYDMVALVAPAGDVLAMDDITYFPWDIDDSGQVTPTDAIYVINRLGQTTTPENALADFNGDGLITPVDAIAAINRLGYSINTGVIETNP
jgi:hypothetical protein